MIGSSTKSDLGGKDYKRDDVVLDPFDLKVAQEAVIDTARVPVVCTPACISDRGTHNDY